MPYPPKDGGSIATLSLAESLKELGHDIGILSMNTSKHYINSVEIPEKINNNLDISIVDINTNINIIKALQNFFFSKLPYNAERFISKKYANKLKEILKKKNYDIVHLEGLYLCPYIDIIKKFPGTKISLRSHNIEHEIWHRTALNEKNPIKSLYLKILAKRIKNLKIKYLNDYDFLIPITDRDARRYNYFGNRKPHIVIQTGIDMTNCKTEPNKSEYPGIFSIGALDWMPNQEGLLWFLDNVWENFSKKYPDIKFYIAGRNAPKSLEKNFARRKNVIFAGEVDDAKEFINSKSVMIVPLLSGSGMRIKIIEGMALGKLIITTSIGTEGIDTGHNKNIIIADTPENFFNEIEKLLTNKEDYFKITKNAVKFVAENYDNKIIAGNLVKFYEKHL